MIRLDGGFAAIAPWIFRTSGGVAPVSKKATRRIYPSIEKPRQFTILNRSHPLLRGARVQCLLGSPGGSSVNIGMTRPWTSVVGPPIYSGTKFGSAPVVDASNSFVTTDSASVIVPPSIGWTIAAIVTPKHTPPASGVRTIMGICQSPGSGTYDRQLCYHNGLWAGYVFDGSTEFADSFVSATVDKTALVVITCTSSLMNIYVMQAGGNGIVGGKSLANSGYTGYSGNTSFVIGQSSSDTGAGDNTAVDFAMMIYKPWNKGQVYQWFNNQFQVLQTLEQRI